MIITSNVCSQQTPSAKGGKGKIQRLDRVSSPDTEIQVMPNLGIAVDRVSCPDTNIAMSGHETRSKGSLPPCQDMKPELG